MIRTFFIAITTLCLEESTSGLKLVASDPIVSVSTAFAACLKPPSRDNYHKASYQRTLQYAQGADRIEPTLCN